MPDPLRYRIVGRARDAPGPAAATDRADGTEARSIRRSTDLHTTRQGGQSLAEFALLVPVFLLILGGALDLGRLFYAHVSIENAAKEGAMYGASNPRCDVEKEGCSEPNTVRWHVLQEAAGLPDVTQQAICLEDDDDLVDVNACEAGDFYQVSVNSRFAMLTPVLAPIFGGELDLESSATSKVMSEAFDPDATPIPIPTPTPAPTPVPTAPPSIAPTLTPSAGPSCTVPDFIGSKKNDASGTWSDAGFTGSLTATTPPNGNYTITSQSMNAGAQKPCDSSIRVGG